MFHDLFSALNFQGFKYLGERKFECLNPPLSWFATLTDDAASRKEKGSEILLSKYFPFIDNFIIDAEIFWRNPDNPYLESGIWTETDEDGNEYQLIAKALTADGDNLLIIENISQRFPEKHRIYQKMRDLALMNEKLIVELNRRQRSLQKEILKTIEQKASLQELKETYEHHAAAVMICQADGEVKVSNNALINIYHASSQDESQYASMLDRWLHEAETQYPEIRHVIDEGRYWEGNFETATLDGEAKRIQLSIAPVWNDDMEVSHFVCIAYDLTEFTSNKDEDDEFVEFDYTTKLPNRRYFWHKLNDSMIESREHHRTLGLILLNIDNFYQLNDEFGHVSADKALVTIAGRLVSGVKEADFVAHLGGDEFAVILQLKDREQDLSPVCERLLAVINEPMFIEETLVHLSCSIGVATLGEANISATDYYKQADLSLYYAKEHGKNRFQVYHSHLESRPKRLRLEQELRVAFIRRQFVVHYQPQISLSEKNKVHLEALIRWNHPKLGMLLPGEFIGLLEDSGVIIPLGNWLIGEVCKHITLLKEEGVSTKVAINISAKQLNNDQFYDSFKNILRKHQVAPESIELEITEHCFVGSDQKVIGTLEKLRQLGVEVAIDDFGAGYSSLSYLKRLPVDVLKIDRSFVIELPDDDNSKAIILSIMQLAEALNLQVVAEGVETEQQLGFLKEQECHFVQGFLFSPAVAFEEVVAILERMRSESEKLVFTNLAANN